MNETPCGDINCPVCAASRTVGSDPIVLKNFAQENSTVSIPANDYRNVELVARTLAEVAEMRGTFSMNNGLTWVDFPVAGGKGTLSVRKSISTDGKPEYEWMLEKK